MRKKQNLVSELIDKDVFNKVEGNLITLTELKQILKKKSASSIAHLIMTRQIKVTKLLGRYYVTKMDLKNYLFPSVLESTRQSNYDYENDRSYKDYLGLDEDSIIPAEITDEKSGKKILQDNSVKTKK